ncbi:MAG: MaoC family dehydratase [Minwuia sp.]|uniref:MaoC family dehydratase n=1 Tax=Minwuia sp. TaxID=2493630 RepID=UPI003A8B0C57
MLTVETPNDLKSHVGADLGTSRWVEVDQKMIQAFADATGDHQWIHVDVERAKKEMPGGKCIAHGFLTLSLIPQLMYEMIKVEKLKNGINYGSNKLRFTNMVPAGSKVRLGMKIKEVNDIAGNGIQLITETRMEIDGQERPALVAETITAYFP